MASLAGGESDVTWVALLAFADRTAAPPHARPPVPVSSLILAFRSNSALARWDAAAKHWTGVKSASSSLLRILAGGLPERDIGELSEDDEPAGDYKQVQDMQEETDSQSLLRLVPCFCLALFHQLEGTRLELEGVRTLEGQRFLRVDQTTDTKQIGRVDYASPGELYALVPDCFVQRRWRRTLRFDRRRIKPSSGITHREPQTYGERDAASLSQSAEAKREALLSQNVDEAQELAEKAHCEPRDMQTPVLGSGQGKALVLRPDNFAAEILRDMQWLLGRLNEGLPDLKDVLDTRKDGIKGDTAHVSGDGSIRGEKRKRGRNVAVGESSDGDAGDPARDEHKGAQHRPSLDADPEAINRTPAGEASALHTAAVSVKSFADSGKAKLATPLFAHCVGLLNSLSSHKAELEQLRDLPMP